MYAPADITHNQYSSTLSIDIISTNHQIISYFLDIGCWTIALPPILQNNTPTKKPKKEVPIIIAHRSILSLKLSAILSEKKAGSTAICIDGNLLLKMQATWRSSSTTHRWKWICLQRTLSFRNASLCSSKWEEMYLFVVVCEMSEIEPMKTDAEVIEHASKSSHSLLHEILFHGWCSTVLRAYHYTVFSP